MTATRTDPGVGFRFRVEVDGLDLTFTKVEGLGAKYEMLTVKEGGENGYVHKLPGRLAYDDVKLTRPVDDKSSTLSEWFTSRRQGVNATISALDPKSEVIASWTLTGVFPHTYSGPTFKAGAAEVLIETLTMSHQGFWTDAAVDSGSGGGSALPASTPTATPAPAPGGGSAGGTTGGPMGGGTGSAGQALGGPVGAAMESAIGNAGAAQDAALDAADDLPDAGGEG